MPEANPLQCTLEEQQQAGMLILYEAQNLGERITNKLNSPLVLSRLLRPHYSCVHWELVEGQEALLLSNRCLLPPQDMQHHWYAKRTRFGCSAASSQSDPVCLSAPLLPLITPSEIWRRPGRHSLTGLTGIHPQQWMLKLVTQIRHSNIPSAQRMGTHSS